MYTVQRTMHFKRHPCTKLSAQDESNLCPLVSLHSFVSMLSFYRKSSRALICNRSFSLSLGCDAYTAGKNDMGRRPHDYKKKGQFFPLTKYTKIFFHHIVVKRIGVEMFGVFPFDRRH